MSKGDYVIHLPSGYKGRIIEVGFDLAKIDWGGWSSWKDYEELRVLDEPA